MAAPAIPLALKILASILGIGLFGGGAARDWASLFGGGPEGRMEKFAKRKSDQEFLSNAMLLLDEKKSRQEGAEERRRTRASEGIDRAAARETLSALTALQQMLGDQNFSANMLSSLSAGSGALASLGGGVSPMGINPDVSPLESGNLFADYGLM